MDMSNEEKEKLTQLRHSTLETINALERLAYSKTKNDYLKLNSKIGDNLISIVEKLSVYKDRCPEEFKRLMDLKNEIIKKKSQT